MGAEAGKAPILGWDVGGTKCAAVVGTADGCILDRAEWPAEAPRGPDAMLADFLERAGALRERHGAVAGVGVSIGGPMNPLTGTVHSPPHLPGWDDVPLAALLADRLGLPVVVEHDAVACLLAEWLWGAAAGCSHAIYLTCGTGCGAGIMAGGRVLRGPRGQTPEAGHVRLMPDGPVMFGKGGCVESFCSAAGMALLAPYRFPERFGGPTDTRRLNALAEAGDGPARAVLEEAARRTGQFCALLADIFIPQVIVLGTLARYFGAWWQEIIRDAFRAEALAANARDTRIVPAALGERLQDLSAIAPCVWRDAQAPCPPAGRAAQSPGS